MKSTSTAVQIHFSKLFRKVADFDNVVNEDVSPVFFNGNIEGRYCGVPAIARQLNGLSDNVVTWVATQYDDHVSLLDITEEEFLKVSAK